MSPIKMSECEVQVTMKSLLYGELQVFSNQTYHPLQGLHMLFRETVFDDEYSRQIFAPENCDLAAFNPRALSCIHLQTFSTNFLEGRAYPVKLREPVANLLAERRGLQVVDAAYDVHDCELSYLTINACNTDGVVVRVGEALLQPAALNIALGETVVFVNVAGSALGIDGQTAALRNPEAFALPQTPDACIGSVTVSRPGEYIYMSTGFGLRTAMTGTFTVCDGDCPGPSVLLPVVLALLGTCLLVACCFFTRRYPSVYLKLRAAMPTLSLRRRGQTSPASSTVPEDSLSHVVALQKPTKVSAARHAIPLSQVQVDLEKAPPPLVATKHGTESKPDYFRGARDFEKQRRLNTR